MSIPELIYTILHISVKEDFKIFLCDEVGLTIEYSNHFPEEILRAVNDAIKSQWDVGHITDSWHLHLEFGNAALQFISAG